jgi:hypothetical protein
MSKQAAWMRSQDEALAEERKKTQSSKSKVASGEENSDEEITFKKRVNNDTYLAYGDKQKK